MKRNVAILRAVRGPLVSLVVAVSVSVLGAGVQPAAASVRTLWIAPFGMINSTFAAAVARDSSGVYVAGGGRGGFRGEPDAGEFPAFVRKFDPAGNLLWSRQFGTGRAGAEDVAADASGVYVAGSEVCGIATCGFVRKYDPSGTLLWSRTVGVGHHYVEVHGVAVVADALYIAGAANGAPGQTVSSRARSFVMRFSLDGTKGWVREYAGANGASAWDIDATRTGVYVTGSWLGAGDEEGTFVRRYQPDGTLRWGKVVTELSDEGGFSISVRGRAIYVSGFFVAPRSHSYLRLLDTKGTVEWTTRAKGWLRNVVATADGVLASGASLRAFSPEGDVLWSFRPDALGHTRNFYGVDVGGGTVYLSGFGHPLGDPIREDDSWVAKLRLPAT